jgi:DNA polymerase I-like protein with 3'-5' exonuclease and polymerase domains
MPVGPDGLVHTTFTNKPSTLRLSSVSPNLQNIPRGGDSEVQKWVKQMFVAPPTHEFWGVDFSGIEAVLVGWFANSHRYTRLAKIDVHTFYTMHALHMLEGKILAADLPDLSWSDADLTDYLGQHKKLYREPRNINKRLVHGGNYLMSPFKAQEVILKEQGIVVAIKDVRALMAVYFELFPEIKAWHRNTCLTVDKSGSIRNPYGFYHKFFRTVEWKKAGKDWDWDYGEDAKRLIAFLPQSTASFIMKDALIRLYQFHPEMRKVLRLSIHDEIFGMSPKSMVDRDIATAEFEMRKPIPELPLDPAWGMGPCLAIDTESKRGQSWGSMQ